MLPQKAKELGEHIREWLLANVKALRKMYTYCGTQKAQ